MFFLKLSQKLIHPSLQSDKLLFTKAKTLLILLLFFLFVLVVYSTSFIFQGILFNTKAVLNYIGVIVVASCLIMLRQSTNILCPLRILNYTGLALITGGVYWSGGFASNDVLWYLVAAISSLLFIGKVDGIVATILSLGAIVFFYIVDVRGIVDFPSDPLTSSIHYRFANTIIITLILFFLVWVLVRNNHRLHKIIQEVQGSQIRESISQDFHDELGNKLASVVHISKRLKNYKTDEERGVMLAIIEKESQQIYDNFRDFIWVNEPNSIVVSALFMYLTDFNQQFFAYEKVKVEGRLFPYNHAIDEELSSNILRHVVPLFKELMTNIYKHAKADRVDWSLACSEGQLKLKIIDNGVGFDVDHAKQGQGLKSIKKRVDQLQAYYEITSVLGKGTSVLLKVSLAK